MKTILVPLDGSTCAKQVLPYVRRLAPILKAKLYLLKIIPHVEEDELVTVTVADVYRRGPAQAARELAHA